MKTTYQQHSVSWSGLLQGNAMLKMSLGLLLKILLPQKAKIVLSGHSTSCLSSFFYLGDSYMCLSRIYLLAFQWQSSVSMTALLLMLPRRKCSWLFCALLFQVAMHANTVLTYVQPWLSSKCGWPNLWFLRGVCFVGPLKRRPLQVIQVRHPE